MKRFLSIIVLSGVAILGVLSVVSARLYNPQTVTSGNLTLNGSLLPGANNTYDLGSYAFSWRDVYASGTVRASATLVGAGTAGAPSYSFLNDSDTGMYSSAANTVNISGGGSTNGLQIGTSITAQVLFSTQDVRPSQDNTMDIGTSALRYRDLSMSRGLFGFSLNASGTSYLSHTVPAANNAFDLGSATSAWRNISASGTVNIGTDGLGAPSVSFVASGTFSASGALTPAAGSAFEFDTRGTTGGSAGLLTVRENGVLVMQVRNDDRWLFYSGGTLRGIFGYESTDDTMRIQGGTSESIGVVGNQGDGATAIGVLLHNTTELSTVGAKLFSIQNSSQLGSEEAFFGAGASNPRLRLLPRTGQTANMLEIASSTPGGTATSTVFSVTSSGGINASGTVSISPSNTATTATLRVGQVTGSVGRGGCIPIIDTNGTQRYISVVAGTLTVSTASCE